MPAPQSIVVHTRDHRRHRRYAWTGTEAHGWLASPAQACVIPTALDVPRFRAGKNGEATIAEIVRGDARGLSDAYAG